MRGSKDAQRIVPSYPIPCSVRPPPPFPRLSPNPLEFPIPNPRHTLRPLCNPPTRLDSHKPCPCPCHARVSLISFCSVSRFSVSARTYLWCADSTCMHTFAQSYARANCCSVPSWLSGFACLVRYARRVGLVFGGLAQLSVEEALSVEMVILLRGKFDGEVFLPLWLGSGRLRGSGSLLRLELGNCSCDLRTL